MGDPISYWPLVVLLIGIAAVILQIVVFRIHASLPWCFPPSYGSMTVSWTNDSAFWVVSKLSGFTTKQTLNSWTLTLAMFYQAKKGLSRHFLM